MATLGSFVLGQGRLGMDALGYQAVAVPPTPVPAPHATVTIGGVVQTTIFEWQTDAKLDNISTATITLPRPLGAEAVKGADVEIAAGVEEDDAEQRVFWGRVNEIGSSFDDGGSTVQLSCAGWGWLLSLPLGADLNFAGRAPTTAVLLSNSVYHVGNKTISWYADPSPDGTTVTYSFNPSYDARFVRVSGEQHGANSYPDEPDKDIRDWSRIEVWQSGKRRGYANFPEDSEQYRDELDYLDDANWTDFDMVIGARIEADEGAVELRFVSGRKPGSSERDEYEVKGVTYRIAARTRPHDIVAALLRERGFGPGAGKNGIPYRVARVYDGDGGTVELGGNGLVNNGLVTVPARSAPWRWATTMLNLWGYHLVDGPHAVRVAVARGAPDDDDAEHAFTEGVDCFSFRRTDTVAETVTDWTVYGASGSDEAGEPFQYASFSAGATPPDYIPDPPGEVAREMTSDLLVSDNLARSVRRVMERETGAAALSVTFEAVPSPAVKLGDVLTLTAPSVGVTEPTAVWVRGVRHSFSIGGFWTDIEVRRVDGSTTAGEDPGIAPMAAITTGTRHVGTATLSWYKDEGGRGTTVDEDFHSGGAYRAVRVRGRFHGSNSWASGAKAASGGRSMVEVWQFGVKLGETAMPVGPEQYSRRRDYESDSNWRDLDLTIAADIEDGITTIRFTSGTATDATRDDYEVKELTVTLYAEATEEGAYASTGADWHSYAPKKAWRWAS